MNEGGGDAEMVSEKLLGLVREAIAVSGFSDTQVYYKVYHLLLFHESKILPAWVGYFVQNNPTLL